MRNLFFVRVFGTLFTVLVLGVCVFEIGFGPWCIEEEVGHNACLTFIAKSYIAPNDLPIGAPQIFDTFSPVSHKNGL